MTKLAIALNDQTVEVKLDWTPQDGNQLTAEVGSRQIPVTLVGSEADSDGLDWIIVDGRPIELTYDPCLRWISASGYIYPLEIRDLEAADTWPCGGDGRIKAPIPGLITSIFVEQGQEVLVGQPLLILEAMKMENEIRASMSGIIESINVTPGQSVAKQDLLVKIAES